MKARVTIYSREAPEITTVVNDVTSVSFIDNESHGPGHNFGILASFKGKALIVSSPNTTAVVIDAS